MDRSVGRLMSVCSFRWEQIIEWVVRFGDGLRGHCNCERCPFLLWVQQEVGKERISKQTNGVRNEPRRAELTDPSG